MNSQRKELFMVIVIIMILEMIMIGEKLKAGLLSLAKNIAKKKVQTCKLFQKTEIAHEKSSIDMIFTVPLITRQMNFYMSVKTGQSFGEILGKISWEIINYPTKSEGENDG